MDPQRSSSYNPQLFAPLFAVEERHFWFRARNRVISSVVCQVTENLTPGYRFLEVGCGTGNVLRSLEDVCAKGTVLGMDLFLEGLRYASSRTGCSLVEADINWPPFRVRFDVVGLFDVLEHISKDLSVLCKIHDVLAPGGALVLTVPAHQSLWSYFDEASGHFRRYSVPELVDKLARAGFQVEYVTPYMAPLLPLVWLQRRLAIRGATNAKAFELAKNDLHILPLVNGILDWLCSLELHLIMRRRVLPDGASLLAVARR